MGGHPATIAAAPARKPPDWQVVPGADGDQGRHDLVGGSRLQQRLEVGQGHEDDLGRLISLHSVDPSFVVRALYCVVMLCSLPPQRKGLQLLSYECALCTVK